jgi:hypothetical protein
MDMETERVLEEGWITFEKRFREQNRYSKGDLDVGALSSRSLTRSQPPLYDLPPLYDDVIHDLPPEYTALPPLAQRQSIVYAVPTTREKSQTRSSAVLKDRMLNIRIDFENITGVREHKKKKPAPAKKAAPPSPPPPPPPPPPPAESGGDGGDDNTNGGDGGGDAGGAGDGNGEGGGGDDWGDDWNVSGSKKDKKKKEQEEEEERLAKEEEERKAAEASANNDLSWAEGNGGGGDDSWAGFASVGKKKKGKVRSTVPFVKLEILSNVAGRSTAWRFPGYKSKRWRTSAGPEL